MPLQDLTPQLRTRLNRVEKIMGWFILAATALIIVGFAYYLYRTAEDRGWFEVHAPFITYADSAEGLAVGDEVRLTGFRVGHITQILSTEARVEGKAPDHNVEIHFDVVGASYYPYIWSGNSRAQLVSSPFGGTHLNISRGTNGYNVYINEEVSEKNLAEVKDSSTLTNLRLGEDIVQGTNIVLPTWSKLSTNLDKLTAMGLTKVWLIDPSSKGKNIVSVWNPEEHRYEKFIGTNIYKLPPDSEPALMDRVNDIVGQIQAAMPNILALTNQLADTLANAEHLTSNLNEVAAGVRPTLDNVKVITDNLRNPHGSLGEWILPTNVNDQLAVTLLNANLAITNANGMLTNVNTNLLMVFNDVGQSLNNLADITSNLNHQVQVNSNMLSDISRTVVNSDDFVQGLKRHWLFRSAFKNEKTNPPDSNPFEPVHSRK